MCIYTHICIYIYIYIYNNNSSNSGNTNSLGRAARRASGPRGWGPCRPRDIIKNHKY